MAVWIDRYNKTVAQIKIPAEMIRIRYSQLTYAKIETMLLDLNDVTWTIHNKTPYRKC